MTHLILDNSPLGPQHPVLILRLFSVDASLIKYSFTKVNHRTENVKQAHQQLLWILWTSRPRTSAPRMSRPREISLCILHPPPSLPSKQQQQGQQQQGQQQQGQQQQGQQKRQQQKRQQQRKQQQKTTTNAV